MGKHFLRVRFACDEELLSSEYWADASLDLTPVGRAVRVSGDFDFEWEGRALNPMGMEGFFMRPTRWGAIGNDYEVWSSETGDKLADFEHDRWRLLGTESIRCGTILGPFSVAETAKSALAGIVSFGWHRHFELDGALTGEIDFEAGVIFPEFNVVFWSGAKEMARSTSILLATVILLQRVLTSSD